MRAFIVVLIAALFCGCGERPAPVVVGPVATPPSTGNVTAAAETLVAGQANANATGDHKTAKAIGKALVEQDKQEIAGSDRWLIFTGILVVAVGLGIMYYLGPKLGGGVAIVGAGMIGGAMFVSAIQPYREEIVGIGSLVALIAGAWHFRAYAAALMHVAHGTEAMASGHVRALVGKIRARGPSLVTRLKAILYHHAGAAIAALPKGPGA